MDAIARRTFPLYFILFCAIFNDVLRIGDSNLSLFRIVMFLGWIYCFCIYWKKFLKAIIIFSFIIIANTIQSLIFFETNMYNIKFDMYRYISHIYFSFCVFSIICFIYAIYLIDKQKFYSRFVFFIKLNAYAILLIFSYISFAKIHPSISIKFFVSNVNNYGMNLVAVMPFFMFNIIQRKNIREFIFFVVTLITLFINDCKLDLIGLFVEMIFLLLFETKYRKIGKYRKPVILIFLLSLCGMVYLFLNDIILINGHGFVELIKAPLSHIFTQTVYSSSMTSVQYRVNIIILGLELLVQTHFIGIGFGNSSVLMRCVLKDYGMREKLFQYDAIALHNAPLEILLDFGILALFFYFLCVRYMIKSVSRKKLSNNQIILGAIGFSLPIWILAPARITTEYYFFMILVYLYLSTKRQNLVNK